MFPTALGLTYVSFPSLVSLLLVVLARKHDAGRGGTVGSSMFEYSLHVCLTNKVKLSTPLLMWW